MKVLLIHGFEGSSESHWFPWLENVLSLKGYEVLNLTFPNSGHPKLDEILNFYSPHMPTVDVIVGHSLGAFIALKLAEMYPLKKLFLVAPVLSDLDFTSLRFLWPESDVDALETCVQNSIDFDSLHFDEAYAYFSQDDPYIPLEHMNLLSDAWGISVLKDRAHFNQKNFPELLESF